MQSCAPATAPVALPSSTTITTIASPSPTPTDTPSGATMELKSIQPTSQYIGGSIILKGTGLDSVTAISIGGGNTTDFLLLGPKAILTFVPVRSNGRRRRHL